MGCFSRSCIGHGSQKNWRVQVCNFRAYFERFRTVQVPHLYQISENRGSAPPPERRHYQNFVFEAAIEGWRGARVLRQQQKRAPIRYTLVNTKMQLPHTRAAPRALLLPRRLRIHFCSTPYSLVSHTAHAYKVRAECGLTSLWRLCLSHASRAACN